MAKKKEEAIAARTAAKKKKPAADAAQTAADAVQAAHDTKTAVEDAQTKAERPKEYVTVDCALLNIRVEPSMSSMRVSQASRGTRLEKIGTAKNGEWIKTPRGYVMAKFVS